MQGNLITERGLELIDSMKNRRSRKLSIHPGPALLSIYGKIADYSEDTFLAEHMDVLPDDFMELCLDLAKETACTLEKEFPDENRLMSLVNEMKELIIPSIEAKFKGGSPGQASNSILDVIKEFEKVLIVP
jgi:hypothetical protein